MTEAKKPRVTSRGRKRPPSSRPRKKQKPAPGFATRSAAVDLLLAAEQEKVPLTAPLDAALAEFSREQDRSFLRNLVLQTLRHRLRLDLVLNAFLKKGGVEGLDAPLRQVLRIGAAQVLLLDGVPPHAIVSTSVDLARTKGHAGTAAVTNAVLRKVVREGRAKWDALTEAPRNAKGLARRFSHPEWMVRRWISRYGPDETERILDWNLQQPDYWLRLAPGQSPPPETKAGWIPGTARCETNPTLLAGFAKGDFAIQDGSGILVGNLAPRVSGRVIDLCAAPGTKSLHLAERAQESSRVGEVSDPKSASVGATHIVSLDVSPGRVARMRRGFSRAVRSGLNALDWAAAAGEAIPIVRPWDGILIDAPCSNLGVLRRRVDAKWRSLESEIEGLAARQVALLGSAAAGVAPGGWLLYSVCTIEPEETTEQRSRFLLEHPQFRPVPLPDWIPAEARGETGEMILRPGQLETDGGYAFVMIRKDEE